WWTRQDLQNRILVLAVDPNAVATLRLSARRMRAIGQVETRILAQHGKGSAQMTELEGVRDREANNFTSALRESFKTVVFPVTKMLRRIEDFRMEFQGNDYRGEGQIIETLTKRGKFVPADQLDGKFETLRQDAEELLFDADAVQAASLRRNAAIRPGWYWLPRGGLDSLIRMAVQRGFWREKDGLVAKKWERVARVSVRQDGFSQNPLVAGRFQLNVTAEDADLIYVSESGPPDPANAAKLDGLVYETAAPAVWFVGVDSKGVARSGEASKWRAPIRVKPDVKRVSGGFRVACRATPRAAIVRATFDGSDPKTGPEVPQGEIDAPKDAIKLRVIAEFDGRFSEEETASLATGVGDRAGGAPVRPKEPLKPDAPARRTARFEPKDTAAAFAALDRLAKPPGAMLYGGAVELIGGRAENDFLTLRLGGGTGIPAACLDKMVKELVELLGVAAPTVKLRLDEIAFPSGRDLASFSDAAGEDFDRIAWKQD
ncbi:MAG: hypothetical protein ACREEU_04105, partial [Acetobacteraceae bacterium]